MQKEKIIVAGFDPPSSSNLGWSVFSTDNPDKIGKFIDGGVFYLPSDESERLLSIRDFLVDLIETHNINTMCFERSIGFGMANIREKIGENTGVIKLVGASYSIKFVALHTSTMAKLFTGFGGSKDKDGVTKKTLTKQKARDIFYPGKSFKEISSKNGKENFEHFADAIGFCVAYLLTQDFVVEGAGGKFEPKTNK